MWFGRKKREEEKPQKTPLDELADSLSPQGFERYREVGKEEMWREKVFTPAMRAAYRRLYQNDERWFGAYSAQEVVDKVVALAVNTWKELIIPKLVVVQNEDPNKCYIHPLLAYGIGMKYGEPPTDYSIELRRIDIPGALPLLELEVDEKPRKNEFYIAISHDVATIGLALSQSEICKSTARCNYALKLMERKVKKREIEPDMMRASLDQLEKIKEANSNS